MCGAGGDRARGLSGQPNRRSWNVGATYRKMAGTTRSTSNRASLSHTRSSNPSRHLRAGPRQRHRRRALFAGRDDLLCPRTTLLPGRTIAVGAVNGALPDAPDAATTGELTRWRKSAPRSPAPPNVMDPTGSR